MTLKSDAKFKEKLTCGFKYDMRNWVNFHPTTQKSEDFISMGSFCPKYTRFELQKYRGVIFHETEHCFKNGVRNWVNFHQSTKKSEKLYFDELFLSKACNVSARKFHWNYVS